MNDPLARPARTRAAGEEGGKSLGERRVSCHGARGADATIRRVTTATPPAARAFLAGEHGVCLRRTQGRETFAVGHALVVKRTLERPRAGLWPWFVTRSAGRRELDALRSLASAGLPVPRAIDWAEERTRSTRVSVCVMERVPHEETLRARLEHASALERRALAGELLALVVRLHGRGFVHRDLYLQHVLIRSRDGALVLIDAGRTRQRESWRSRWHVKELASLLHSTPASVGPRERLRFLAGWLDARGIEGRARRRRWLARIVRKAARIAAHVPKDERGGTP